MADNLSLDVLAIAAHPDDVEITCGGLIIKMARMGRRTGILDLARGEMGTYGNENDRTEEAAAAGKIMGLAYRSNLGIPDSGIEFTQENKLRIAQVIRDTQPELVVLPHWEQRHPDHLACSRLGYDACFLAGLSKLDIDGKPHRPRKVIYASYYRNRVHSFLVDISDVFAQKIEAVAAYRSQFGDHEKSQTGGITGINLEELKEDDSKDVFSPGIGIYDLMYTRGRALGQLVGVEYAEGFVVKENILVDDPQKMPVRSL